MLILGPPGTGKTHYLSNNIVPSLDGKVCVLSFTKAGAKEIADRLDGKGNFVGTIHSFCFKELEMISQQVLMPHILKMSNRLKRPSAIGETPKKARTQKKAEKVK